ncbi:MFS transporter [Acidibrevibacterium fodinaquatile]|jgi:hypothetical protein|nr:MFS transporter [Acidibrevibacterium fodinaquatile]
MKLNLKENLNLSAVDKPLLWITACHAKALERLGNAIRARDAAAKQESML